MNFLKIVELLSGVKSEYSNVTNESFFKTYFSKGTYGEYLTFRYLEELGESYILPNIYIQKENGTYTEIDIICITTKGIIVVESKNYAGSIYGNMYDINWTQYFSKYNKFKFYNPIKQNYSHIKALNEYLKTLQIENITMDNYISMIVFSNRCELRKITYNKDKDVICKRNKFKEAFIEYMKDKKDILTKEEVRNIYYKLKTNIKATKEVKEKHIKNINSFKSTL